jgi:hypothetical protein
MYAKAEEIAIFKAAAEKLGKDSYLGPTLLALIPHLESDMRSDFIPDLKSYIEFEQNHLDGIINRRDVATKKLLELGHQVDAKESQLRRLESELASAKEKVNDLGRRLVSLA